jgi:xylulokinase
LCCDLGSSGLRLGVVDAGGEVLAQASVPLTVGIEADGRSEIDPAYWHRAFVTAAAQVADSDAGVLDGVAAVAICGMTRTQVMVDAAGVPVRPAITWRDTRAGSVAAEFAAASGIASVDAFHPVARLAFIARREPAAFARTRHVLDPKDYLALWLTGVAASDAISLARLAECPASPVAEIEAVRALLPPLLPPCSRIGAIKAGLPAPLERLAGAPAFMVSHDTWAAVVGLGALRHGLAYNISGTSEVLGVFGARGAVADGLMTVQWGDGMFQLGGPSQTGADVLAWLQGLLGPDVPGLVASARDAPPHARPLLFLPFLQGERVPYWNADLRGAFVGLDRGHGPADLVRAVLEGVALANRDVLARAEQAIGVTAGEIRIGGGGGKNPAWCQIKADVCGRAVVACEGDEPGLVGCAATALTGLGAFGSLADAQDRMAKVRAVFTPDAALRARYDALFALYRQAVASNAALAAGLAAVPAAGG